MCVIVVVIFVLFVLFCMSVCRLWLVDVNRYRYSLFLVDSWVCV